MRKLISIIILILLTAVCFVGCNKTESKTPAEWCEEEVIYQLGGYLEGGLGVYSIHTEECTFNTDEDLGDYVAYACKITVFDCENDSEWSKGYYVFTCVIFYKPPKVYNAFCNFNAITPQIKEEQILDLDVIVVNNDKMVEEIWR